MTELARRTIEELLARYELEPTLKDVFVEGYFDKDVLSCCFRNNGQIDRAIYAIESVDVPPNLLHSFHLSDGNKQRVIALARTLAKELGDCQYRCFVDRDLDHWFGPLESTPRLVWSEYCSIELYFFSDELLQQILIASAKCKIPTWVDYMDSLIVALRGLYLARLVDRELGFSLKWITADRCLSINGSRINFELSEFIHRVLLKNGKAGDEEQFIEAFVRWDNKLTGDCRNFIRGHDFVDLIAWSILNFGGLRAFASSLAVERLLVLLSLQIPSLVTAIH